ncbi:MAG: CocE/NonD family hydrolase [Chloroflexia bacterium]|nr:CocE/NonD family hydrolase [Chloroflexia bacterium]
MSKERWLGLAALGLLGAAGYTFRRQILARLLGLPPVRNDVVVERGLAIPMPDGARLMADHYRPRAAGDCPTLLIRSCYGRWTEAGLYGIAFGELAQRFAERGYHVVLQNVRGTYDSEGEFVPLVDEAADGRATLDWIAEQPWFNGALGLWGPSYLGYVQWAIAADAPPYLRALVPIIAFSRGYGASYPQGGLALDLALRIGHIFYAGEDQERTSLGDFLQWRTHMERVLRRAFAHLPLREADLITLGRPSEFYRQSLAHQREDHPFWQALDHHDSLDRVRAPAHLISGWYDLFLRDLLDDYAALRAAGRRPYLTVGPWYHVDFRWLSPALDQSLAWFDAHLKGQRDRLRRSPVRYYMLGAEEWREAPDWPPPSRPQRYFLHAGGALAPAPPAADGAPAAYTYDPADPTPNLAGPLLLDPAGPADQRPLEARPDVLCYTTPPLEQPLELVGTVRLELYARSSLAHTDFVGRLCDVHPDGRSINICDGFVRLEPEDGSAQPDGSLRLEIELAPTAVRFQRGHRLRLQVCSGGHPRWNRNLGTGEPLAGATTMAVARQTIYHDREHPSALVLPLNVGD